MKHSRTPSSHRQRKTTEPQHHMGKQLSADFSAPLILQFSHRLIRSI
nr:MAG TPA: hypothetical protein [Caudoviricetes sp.]